MRIKHYFSRVVTLPPHIVIKKTFGKIRHLISKLYKSRYVQWYTTYSTNPINGSLHRYFLNIENLQLTSLADELNGLNTNYLQHRFDLLGSGWVQVKYGMRCRGVEGFRYDNEVVGLIDHEGVWLEGRINNANLAQSKHIWCLIDKGYLPIDWQLDFKSGYRWDEKTWHQDIVYSHKAGVDVKVPWELSRMQHFPHLAWGCHKDVSLNESDKALSVREFRNQILDFIATNPPGFGANWVCTMDVSIRVVNWLVAYDLFRTFGAKFDDDFEQVFQRSVYDHGRHIIYNLEWTAELTSNHYLANIAGLLFVAAYLPQSIEIDAWLAFSVQELVNEVKHQFHAEGSNFEASTSYHRLSAEMVIYATALVLALPANKKKALQHYDDASWLRVAPRVKPAPVALYTQGPVISPFPVWYISRLEKMAEFTIAITRPDGSITQFGDNDSGRFLKLFPNYVLLNKDEAKQRFLNLADYCGNTDKGYWLEQGLDHRHLVAAINALFNRKDFAEFAGSAAIETDVVRQLVSECCFNTQSETVKQAPFVAYPEFGLYVYRTSRFYLIVRCGSVGQNGNGGHAHNDQLSFELCVDGIPFLIDPGTYLYTPSPEQRNAFRSTANHNTLCIKDKEQNKFVPISLFMLTEKAFAKVIESSPTHIQMEHQGFGNIHYRTIQVNTASDEIVILDTCQNTEPVSVNFVLAPGVQAVIEDKIVRLRHGEKVIQVSADAGDWQQRTACSSIGYGMIEPTNIISLDGVKRQSDVRIRIQ